MFSKLNISDILIIIFFLFLISCAVERLIEIIKQLFPQKEWKDQKLWKLTMILIGIPIGFLISIFLYTILFEASLTDRVILSFLTSIITSGSSKYWHDLLLAIVKIPIAK